ncbi:hypothetical protein GCM10028800_05360 [Nesterenkonia populi]
MSETLQRTVRRRSEVRDAEARAGAEDEFITTSFAGSSLIRFKGLGLKPTLSDWPDAGGRSPVGQSQYSVAPLLKVVTVTLA